MHGNKAWQRAKKLTDTSSISKEAILSIFDQFLGRAGDRLSSIC
jgi:hypothetical protein